ncbi:MAG: type II toxin-antitoxin system HicB family antitoxin [Cyanomargarita calcarea GSE-NOS-MK-12-04C]|jgi:hypothetical protein|uniref:Type II toxin-antitoxin system HicB family antitoxin n=1 Tax=Cyanomargarita calcarea GSE-NOS-MK-12-04C TaxID=2839659 RepID=A0A951UWX7_9CYAN|nr:type II toxin-antitoxin system HicB family antitoxin [Cyanomargarita calcarea GSE-NOS-MK-12-04C]
MSQFSLRLPETLHQQLIHLAEGEGIPLEQYIVYALTRQVALTYSIQATSLASINQQKQSFKELLIGLGKTDADEVESILAEREMVDPEPELSSDTIIRLQQRMRDGLLS